MEKILALKNTLKNFIPENDHSILEVSITPAIIGKENSSFLNLMRMQQNPIIYKDDQEKDFDIIKDTQYDAKYCYNTAYKILSR